MKKIISIEDLVSQNEKIRSEKKLYDKMCRTFIEENRKFKAGQLVKINLEKKLSWHYSFKLGVISTSKYPVLGGSTFRGSVNSEIIYSVHPVSEKTGKILGNRSCAKVVESDLISANNTNDHA